MTEENLSRHMEDLFDFEGRRFPAEMPDGGNKGSLKKEQMKLRT
jgi:hypothetical protein